MRKNRFANGLLLLTGLILFTFSCSEEKLTEENLTSNCGQVDVQAVSTININPIDHSQSAAIRLFSGGYNIVEKNKCFIIACTVFDDYTTKKNTFENNITVEVSFDIYSDDDAFSDTKSFTVNKGDASEKLLKLFTFSEAFPIGTYYYKITEIKITYLEECPTGTNNKTIDGEEVPQAENTEAEVIVQLGTFESKTTSSFTINGNTVLTDDTEVSEYGIVYTNSSTANYVQSNEDIDNFSVEVTALEPNTTYIVRAYADQNGTKYYSKDFVEVTTNNVVNPTITVGTELKDITSTSVTVAGSSVTGGDPASTEFGVAYSLTNSTSDIVEHIISAGSASNYDVTISELNANTSYYVWAYARQNGIYIYSETPVLATTSAAIPSVIFNGVSYRIDGGDYISYTTDGISHMAISMHRYNGEVQDFNIGIELRSNDGFKSGTYTFGTGDLYFNDVTEVALNNTQDFKKATGGTITLAINENRDYTVVMDVQTEGGALTGTYTVLGEFGSEF